MRSATKKRVEKTQNGPKLDHDDRSHAKYGPSSMKRIVECPVSVFISDGLPDKGPTRYSKGGHLGHEVAELYIKAKLEGKRYPTKIDDKYTSEMRLHAVGYADYIYECVKDYLQYKHTWFVETKLVLDEERDCWGTPDFVFVCRIKDKLFVILVDYKYGEGIVVDTKDNWQIETYLLAAIKEFSGQLPISQMVGHIYQPRVEFDAEPVTYDPQYLLTERLPIINQRIDMIEGWFRDKEIPEDDLQEYQNVGSWCQFCKAKAICKPYHQKNMGNILDIYKKAVKTFGTKKKAFANIDACLEKGILSNEELSFIALNASKIKSLVSGAPKAAMALIAKGVHLPDVKVIETSDKRTWIDDEKKLIRGLKALGVDNPVITTTKIISISDVEKAIGEGKIEHLTTKPGVNYKLVSEDHKKPAVKFGLNVIALFKNAMNKSSSGGEEEDEE